MTAADARADRLAALHHAAFTTPRPWRAAEIASFLNDASCFLLEAPDAFLLGRVIAGEAELLTLAVAPVARRRGLGRALVADFAEQARTRGATAAFLEVSAENSAARTLYLACGWQVTGRRRQYYRTPDGSRVDAEIMGISLA
ncbi:GNAT family N-acetyltransferase [Pseudooceanicola aestuarii]|uniref:GNAT family N-acetyltransferase n=1 Tax=Pseudooceanicola aestuarii TaxID=2697319 RepID=UPI0013D35E10|nr:GNAT family N-acetyltransferase [Pseudooceanicola aestuarii]